MLTVAIYIYKFLPMIKNIAEELGHGHWCVRVYFFFLADMSLKSLYLKMYIEHNIIFIRPPRSISDINASPPFIARIHTYIYLYKHEADAPQPNIIIIIYAFKIQHTCVRYQRFFMSSARLEIEIHFLMMLVKCGRRFIDASVSLKFSFFAFWNIISIN